MNIEAVMFYLSIGLAVAFMAFLLDTVFDGVVVKVLPWWALSLLFVAAVLIWPLCVASIFAECAFKKPTDDNDW